MWPQIIFIALNMIGLGIVLGKHGQPHDAYSAWVAVTAVIIDMGLLYWGGFFAGFGV